MATGTKRIKRAKFDPDLFPPKLILPPSRRLALQDEIANEVPRYHGASPYQTSAALKILEDQVSGGAVTEDLLASDAQIKGAVAAWAALRTAEEAREEYIPYSVDELTTAGLMPPWVEGNPAARLGAERLLTALREAKERPY